MTGILMSSGMAPSGYAPVILLTMAISGTPAHIYADETDISR